MIILISFEPPLPQHARPVIDMLLRGNLAGYMRLQYIIAPVACRQGTDEPINASTVPIIKMLGC
eukprot:scaffold285724_cov42-Prasinocladus_malaysianus.AAC.1